ncbi:formate dehydrogenase [Pigmentiphaga litoralis]|uniref:formate dehydrogenase n=1 Tax=Pigmentiphaga litoralis TaxID=516702 RepID=UPI003B43344F
MSEQNPSRLSRRGFFIAAASTGAVAAGAVVMPQVKPVATATAATPPAPKRRRWLSRQ